MKIAQFKLENWMNVYEASAKYDLTTTCIEPLSVYQLCDLASVSLPKELFATPLSYGDIQGSIRLKNAIKSLYKSVDTSNITVTHGAIGANQLVFLSLLEKGDEVVSIVPTYQQHYSIPESLGADVKLLFLKESNRWVPDVNELNRVVTSKTKLICLNNPNNPTGTVIPNDVLKQIVEIAKQKNVWILSDEVYRGLNFYGERYSDSIVDLYEKGISVGSMSKTYSLPGLRVGWICANKTLINEVNHQRQYNTISVSILDDYFSSLAIENREYIENRNFDIIKYNFDIFKKWVSSEENIRCVLPNAGTTALVKYRKNMRSRDLCRYLQNRTGVALLPGETMEMEGYVRLGFCQSAGVLEEALGLFSDYLREI